MVQQSTTTTAIEKNQQHYKVMWVYQGFAENIPAMYDKPYNLCKWWIREHMFDAQYAKGQFKVLSMIYETKTS